MQGTALCDRLSGPLAAASLSILASEIGIVFAACARAFRLSVFLLPYSPQFGFASDLERRTSDFQLRRPALCAARRFLCARRLWSADCDPAAELTERVAEFGKGTGFWKIGSVSTRVGAAAVAVDEAAGRAQLQGPEFTSRNSRCFVGWSPVPDAGGIHGSPEALPLVRAEARQGFRLTSGDPLAVSVSKLTCFELDDAAGSVTANQNEAERCGKIVWELGFGLADTCQGPGIRVAWLNTILRAVIR